MESCKQQLRIDYFDIVKGITILTVVYVHSGAGIGPLKYFVSYYMPLFFVISGYFYKQRSIFDTIKRCARQLLVPFYVSGIVGIIISRFLFLNLSIDDYHRYIMGLVLGPVMNYSGIPIHCLWFFYALFVARVIFAILDRIFSAQIGFAVSIILFVLSVRLQELFGLQSWFYFLHGFSGVVFLYIGRFCRLCCLFEKKVSCALILFFMFACIYSLPNIYMDHLVFDDTIKDMILASLMSIGTIFLVQKISCLPYSFIRDGSFILRRVGYHSLLVYSVEAIVFISGFKDVFGTSIVVYFTEKSLLWRVGMGGTRLFIVLAIAYIIVKLQVFIKQNRI